MYFMVEHKQSSSAFILNLNNKYEYKTMILSLLFFSLEIYIFIYLFDFFIDFLNGNSFKPKNDENTYFFFNINR